MNAWQMWVAIAGIGDVRGVVLTGLDDVQVFYMGKKLVMLSPIVPMMEASLGYATWYCSAR